jgi:hypothetical protein
MRQGTIRRAVLLDASLTAVLLLSLAGPAAQSPPPPPSPPPAESSAPPAAAPQAPASATQESPATGAEPQAAPSPPEAPAAPPRIIRVVCTDHLCGHCDGKCHKDSGHVAVDKKGHCACTPDEGSPLDTATRQAHARNPPK